MARRSGSIPPDLRDRIPNGLSIIIWLAANATVGSWPGTKWLVTAAGWTAWFIIGLWAGLDDRRKTPPDPTVTVGLRSKLWFQNTILLAGSALSAAYMAAALWMGVYWGLASVALFLLLAGVAFWLKLLHWRRDGVERDRIAAGLCGHCGYDLQATSDGQPCPECGTLPPIPAPVSIPDPAPGPMRPREPMAELPPPTGRPICANCGHDMRGRGHGRTCPECGVIYGVEWIEEVKG
jgi:hypothetical protein